MHFSCSNLPKWHILAPLCITSSRQTARHNTNEGAASENYVLWEISTAWAKMETTALWHPPNQSFQTVKNAMFATGQMHLTKGRKMILCLLLLQVNQGWAQRKYAVGFHPSWLGRDCIKLRPRLCLLIFFNEVPEGRRRCRWMAFH